MALHTNRENCLHKILSDFQGNHSGTINSLFNYYYDKKGSTFQKKCSVIRVIIGLYIDFFEQYENSKEIVNNDDKKVYFANIFLNEPTGKSIEQRLLSGEIPSVKITGKGFTRANVDIFHSQTGLKASDNFMSKLWLDLQEKMLTKPKSYFNEFGDEDFDIEILKKIKDKLLDVNSNDFEHQAPEMHTTEAVSESVSISKRIDPSKLKASQQDEEIQLDRKSTIPGNSGKQ